MVCRNDDGWGRGGVSERNGVEAASGERMTPCEAPEGKPGAFENAEPDERDVGIFRTGREIKALGGTEGVEDRRQNRFVQPVNAADREAGLRVRHFDQEGRRESGTDLGAELNCLSAAV
jgi:hypothetical protein